MPHALALVIPREFPSRHVCHLRFIHSEMRTCIGFHSRPATQTFLEATNITNLFRSKQIRPPNNCSWIMTNHVVSWCSTNADGELYTTISRRFSVNGLTQPWTYLHTHTHTLATLVVRSQRMQWPAPRWNVLYIFWRCRLAGLDKRDDFCTHSYRDKTTMERVFDSSELFR